MSTISTSGIAPNSVIRSEHVLRIINALSNVSNNDILISGSLVVTGSTALSGSLNVTRGITGSLLGTSSNAISASYTANASSATSASYALTASYVLGGGTVLNTGSFATTGSNQFSGSQGITGSLNIKDGSIGLNNGSFVTADTFSIMSVYSNIITIENQGSPFDTTLLGQGLLSYSSGSNSQALMFPASLLTGNRTITLPNDTGTVALTYNTATTGSNTFNGNQLVIGSVRIGEVLTLVPNNPLPSGQPTGSIAVSGSGVDCKPYFWNGITWTSLI